MSLFRLVEAEKAGRRQRRRACALLEVSRSASTMAASTARRVTGST